MSLNRYSLILFVIIKINRIIIMQQTWKEYNQDQNRHNNFNSSSFVSDNNSNNNRRLNTTSLKILQKIKSIINRFINRGSHEFIQWILNLRTYELKIHYNITIKNYVNWVEN